MDTIAWFQLNISKSLGWMHLFHLDQCISSVKNFVCHQSRISCVISVRKVCHSPDWVKNVQSIKVFLTSCSQQFDSTSTSSQSCAPQDWVSRYWATSHKYFDVLWQTSTQDKFLLLGVSHPVKTFAEPPYSPFALILFFLMWKKVTFS